jgi:hypothetical protein
MSLRFAVVFEHYDDFVTATELADRVFCECHDWVNDYLPHTRQWLSDHRGARFTWTGIKNDAMSVGVRVHGHFLDGPGLADAASARRAIKYLREVDDALHAIMLIRDRDDQPERRQGLEQARIEHASVLARPVVVIGFAVVERESWVISGFQPIDGDEQTRLDNLRQELGFFPHENSHQLTASKDDTAPRSPKRVLRALTGGVNDRERSCWNDTPLGVLRQRGSENGLVEFLNEVRDRLAPLIGHVPRKSD